MSVQNFLNFLDDMQKKITLGQQILKSITIRRINGKCETKKKKEIGPPAVMIMISI